MPNIKRSTNSAPPKDFFGFWGVKLFSEAEVCIMFAVGLVMWIKGGRKN
jgi:hypothetical protein